MYSSFECGKIGRANVLKDYCYLRCRLNSNIERQKIIFRFFLLAK